MSGDTSNTQYPGRPDYTGPASGLGAYVHHDRQVEYCQSFKERITVIMRDKPEHERATRLHCLAYIDPTGKPWMAEFRLWSKALWTAHAAELKALVDRLVPDAPWNGRELVFPLPDKDWYPERTT